MLCQALETKYILLQFFPSAFSSILKLLDNVWDYSAYPVQLLEKTYY